MVTVGGAITYTLTMANAGPSVASNVVVTDTLPSEIQNPRTTSPGCSITDSVLTCERTSLVVNGRSSATVTGTIDPATASESVRNTATISADSIDPHTGNNSSAVTVTVTGTPRVELVKTAGVPTDANGDDRIGAGDTVAYTLTVRNTGPTVLTEIAITDPLLGGSITCVAADGVTLSPGAELSCAPVLYTLTQQDVNAGTVHNTATVTANSPRGTATDDGEATSRIVGTRGISLAKAAGNVSDNDGDGAIGAGDGLDYTFTVQNTGTTSLTNIVITDPMLGGVVECSALADITLAPGDSQGCAPISYVLKQEDVDNGVVANTASVSADSPRGSVSDTAQANVVVHGTDAIELVKEAGSAVDTTGDGHIGAGDRVSYTFTIRNVGTTTLTQLAISDPRLGGALDCPNFAGTNLAPRDTVSCGPVSYTLTQQNVEAGHASNTATATATGSDQVTDTGSTDVLITGFAEILLTKTAGTPADANDDGRIGVGDTVDYTFTVKNTGTTTLTNAVITDPLLGGAVTCAELVDTQLQPAQEVTCTPVAYTLTQADVDARTVHNTASVSAESARGSVTDTAVAEVAVTGTDAVELDKQAGEATDTTGDGRIGAGDRVNYTFTVRNTGTTTLTNAVITDPLLGGEVACAELVDIPLAPGEGVTCAPVSYLLTQADIDAGTVENRASVAADAPNGSVSASAEAVVTLEGTDGVELDKAGSVTDSNGDGRVDVGDQIGYTFTVRNTGTTMLERECLSNGVSGVFV